MSGLDDLPDAFTMDDLDEQREDRQSFREAMKRARQAEGIEEQDERDPYYDAPDEEVAKWRNQQR